MLFSFQNTTVMITNHKQSRFRLLNALYEFTGGSTRKWVNSKELCQAQGIPFDADAFNYLMDEGLITYYGAAYTCYLTHQGVKAVEAAWENPNKPTQYFPAIADMKPLNG